MKKLIKPVAFLLLAVLIVWVVFLLLKSGNLLDGPESIAWDQTGKRFLISNTNGKSIVSMDDKNRMKPFVEKGLKSPRGLAIRDGKLFVADGSSVAIIDLNTAKILSTLPIPEAKMLNDLAFDKKGNLYITDTEVNCVHLLDPSLKHIQKVISPLLKSPNGIIYDMPRDQMFIVGFADRSPVLSLSTKDQSVRVFMDSIYSKLDGIAIDDLGRIYISSWAQAMIIEIPQEQNRFIAQFKDLKDAADILYYLPNNELLVPLFSQNRIQRISLD